MIPGTGPLKLLTPKATVKLDRSRCSRHRFALSGCQLCVDLCPHSAIAWAESGLYRDDSRCQGCLLCAAACPTGAIGAVDLGLMEILDVLQREERPVLACSMCSQAQGHARLPCLGLLADVELLLALQMILDKPLVLNLSCCSGCPNEGMIAYVEDAVRGVKSIGGDAIAQVLLPRAAHEVEFLEAGLSRRELFALFKRKARKGTASWLERLQGEPPREFRAKGLTQGRILLLRVLKELPDRGVASQIASSFPTLEIQDSCTNCTGCVGVCPTGALSSPHDLRGKPFFEREFCTDCGVCQVFCRPSAIQMISCSSN